MKNTIIILAVLLSCVAVLAQEPPPPTMSQFWGTIYGSGNYNDDFNAPYFEQEHGKLAPSSSKSQSSSDDNYESKVRFGIRAALSFQNINIEEEGYEDLNLGGFGIPFGLIINVPISDRISIEIGTDFHYRNFTDSGVDTISSRYGYEYIPWKETIAEYALSFPATIQFATSPPPNFAVYAEGGIQLDVPLSTEITTEYGGEEYDPESMDDRNIDFGFILGGGISFNLGSKTIRLGYRYINNFTNFVNIDDEGYGTLTQHQISLGFMF